LLVFILLNRSSVGEDTDTTQSPKCDAKRGSERKPKAQSKNPPASSVQNSLSRCGGKLAVGNNSTMLPNDFLSVTYGLRCRLSARTVTEDCLWDSVERLRSRSTREWPFHNLNSIKWQKETDSVGNMSRVPGAGFAAHGMAHCRAAHNREISSIRLGSPP
jgi:hypothetical protein